MLFFAIDSIVHASDDRYAGKALTPRNIIIIVVWSMLFPALHFIWKKWKSYPLAYDNWYLSIFWLDMFGNWQDLYNLIGWWDTIPHIHGPGALTIVFRGLGRYSVMASTGASNMLHTGLEIQEFLGDLIGGTHNVQGEADTVHDLACGLIGSWLYVALFPLYYRVRGTNPPPPEK